MAKKVAKEVKEEVKETKTFNIDLNMKISSAYNTDLEVRTVKLTLTKDFRRILNTFAVKTLARKKYEGRTLNSGSIDRVTKERYALKKEVAQYIEQGSPDTQYILYSLFENDEQLDYVFLVETLIDARIAINVFAHFVKYITKIAIDREIVLSTNIVADIVSQNEELGEENK